MPVALPTRPADPRLAVTRRGFLTGLAAAGALAGCAAPAGDAPGRPATRPFTHARGTTEVPVAPQRVVSLHSTALTWQLATLGVPSVGTAAAAPADPAQYLRLADPGAAAALDGLVSVGEAEVSVERVAALGPDLIVGGDYHDDLYDRLAAIAPTVLLPSDLPNGRFFGVQGALAELTGTVPVLERLHAEYDARVAALRDGSGVDWAALEWLVLDEITGAEVVGLVGLTADGPAHRVLADLGAPLAASARAHATGGPFAELSRELVAGLDADAVFVAPPYTDLVVDATTPVSPDLLELLASTRAARADRVVPVGLHWTNANVAALGRIVDDLAALAAAGRLPGRA